MTRLLATLFGFLMVGLVAFGSHGLAVIAAVSAGAAVVLGVAYRTAATLAVLLAVCTIAAAHPAPVLVAWSGLCAAAYLVCRHAPGAPAVVASWPTAVAAVGFTIIGLVATAFPLHLPWLPLLAPLAVLAIYVLATRPYLR